MRTRLVGPCSVRAIGSVATLLVFCASAPGHVSGKPRARTANPLRACLSSPQGRTEAGRNACFRAAEDPNDPFIACLHSPQGRDTYIGMMDCQRAELDRTYFRLQHLYADLARRLPKAQARALQRERNAWFVQRNKACAREDLQSDMLDCMIQKNEDKAGQLKRRLSSSASARQ